MINFKKVLLNSFVAVALLSSITTVQADTIVQSQSFLFEDFNLDPSATFGPIEVVDSDFFTASFLPFDTSLGTLNSVTISLTDFTAQAMGPANGEQRTLTGSLAGPVVFGDLVGGVVPSGFALAGFGQGLGTTLPGTGPGTVLLDLTSMPPPGQTVNGFDDEIILVNDFTTGTGPGVFQLATGLGPVGVNLNDAFEIAGNINSVDVSTSGTISLTFDFTPVPEPSSGLVLGLLAAAVFGSRRRR